MKKTKIKLGVKPYSVSLKIADKIYKAEAETIAEALANINVERQLIKGKGILSIGKGEKKSKDIILYPFQLRRFLVNKTYRIILEKRFNLLLN